MNTKHTAFRVFDLKTTSREIGGRVDDLKGMMQAREAKWRRVCSLPRSRRPGSDVFRRNTYFATQSHAPRLRLELSPFIDDHPTLPL